MTPVKKPEMPLQGKGLTRDHFALLEVIGKGSYAKVLLVEHIQTGELFAMKVLKKEMVEKRNGLQHIKNERHILSEIDHPFVIKFRGCFQDHTRLYFLMEYCPGGDLYSLLFKVRKFNEFQTRFYAAQIVLALEHLHNQDIVYRDLKPENIILDENGYIRITDFGLSRTGVKDASGARSICGTPEYLAPEIVFNMEYGKAVDWWMLGCVIFEMLTGMPPFYSNDKAEMYEAVKFGTPNYSPNWEPNTRNLLESLLKKNPLVRLGSTSKVRDHPWFEDVNWDALLKMQYEAPFVPKLTSPTDVQHFSQEFTELPLNSLSLTNSSPSKYIHYEGFTYDCDWNHSLALKPKVDLEVLRVTKASETEEEEGSV